MQAVGACADVYWVGKTMVIDAAIHRELPCLRTAVGITLACRSGTVEFGGGAAVDIRSGDGPAFGTGISGQGDGNKPNLTKDGSSNVMKTGGDDRIMGGNRPDIIQIGKGNMA